MNSQLLGMAESYLNTLIIGVVILLAGFTLGILARKFLYRVLKEIELNAIIKKMGLLYDVERGISSLAAYLIYLITIVWFLELLNITSVVLYLVVGAILMLVILTCIVGLKDVIPNLVAWMVIQKKQHIVEGKKVEIREISGVVEKVGYLETEIRTEEDDVLYIPNSLFLKSKYKMTEQRRRS